MRGQETWSRGKAFQSRVISGPVTTRGSGLHASSLPPSFHSAATQNQDPDLTPITLSQAIKTSYLYAENYKCLYIKKSITMAKPLPLQTYRLKERFSGSLGYHR